MILENVFASNFVGPSTSNNYCNYFSPINFTLSFLTVVTREKSSQCNKVKTNVVGEKMTIEILILSLLQGITSKIILV